MGHVRVETVIFQKNTAYTIRMKRIILITATAVAAVFITAVFLCVQILNGAQSVSAFSAREMRLVLDAGHGGIDGGVVGSETGKKESDINLSITLYLKEVLEDMGFEITLTRKTEAGLYGAPTKGFKRRDMESRKEIIEKVQPALVLSIHQNYYPSKTLRGGQIFYNKANENSQKLAEILQTQVNNLYAKEGVKSRKEQAGQYYMLECTPYPAVIIECGFLSNAQDEKLLLSPAWEKEFSHAIAAGVTEYFSHLLG